MRTSGVKLVAEVDGYKRNMDAAAKSTDGAKRSIDGLGESSTTTGRKADDLGGDFRDTAKDARALKDEISQVQQSLAGLAREFTATSSAADRVDITKNIRKQQGELRQLLKVQNLLPDAGDAAKAGMTLAQKVGEGLTKAIPPQMTTALIAGGIAASPFLAATLVGAISGGVGLGGIGAGVALALKDPKVKKEAKGLGDFVSEQLRGSARNFGPAMTASIGIARKEIGELGDETDRIFANSAKFLIPLTQSGASAVGDIVEGLDRVVAKSGPALAQIGDGIEGVGEQVENFLNMIADNSDAGAKALGDLFTLIEFGMLSLTTATNLLAKAYNFGTQWTNLIPGLNKVTKDFGETATGTAGATGMLGDETAEAAEKAEQLKKNQELLKTASDALKLAQDGLQESLDSLGGKTTTAARNADALRTAMDNLYGASIRQTEANEAYEASWDDLSDSVKTNKSSLDIHTSAGRANRDALQGLLTSNNELYIANIAAGQSVDSARRKHQDRTEAVREEARRLGLNREETQKLINTYGRIPGKKTTDLLLDGVKGVIDELKKLYTMQRALALGININLVTGTGTTKDFKATGGPISGPGTGTSDDVPIMASNGEHMWTAAEVRAAGGHGEVLAMRKAVLGGRPHIAHHATGGPILTPVDSSRRWPFVTNVSDARVMSRAEAESKVAPSFGSWPSSPSAQRGDSGVWRRVLQLIKSGPDQGSFGNAYRPGDPKWHGSGRAVDWMGYNMDALATYLAGKRPLELIHRTRKRDYAYTRGVNKGSFNNSLMEAHRNHIHIAMGRGGVINEHVLGVGLRSGASYEFGERGIPETVTPGTPQYLPARATAAPVIVIQAADGPDMAATNAILQGILAATQNVGPDVAEALAGGVRRTLQAARGRGLVATP